MMYKRWKLMLAAVSLAVSTNASLAQSAPDQVVQITPYVWAMGVGGDIRPFAASPTVSIDKSFSELLKDSDGAFFISGYMRRDDLIFIGDFSASSSSRSGTVRVPSPPGTLPAEGALRQKSVTALTGYRVAETSELTFDVLAGVRHWRARGGIDVPLIPGASAARSRNFTDPLVSVRANFQIAAAWSALLYIDVGGFGVGSRSTSQVLGTANYQLRENVFLSAGYRHLHFDYRDSGSRLDMRMGGPILGVTIQL